MSTRQKRCILHIGWHKTGTTALQFTAYELRHLLKQHNICYPEWHSNHSNILVSASRSKNGSYYAELFTPHRKDDFKNNKRKAARKILLDTLKSCQQDTIFFSAEDLNLLDEEEIQRLKLMLAPYYDEFYIVAFVRNYFGYLNSAVQQLIRMGFRFADIHEMAEQDSDRFRDMRVIGPAPRYRERLKRWVNIFGKENVFVHDYEQLKLTNENIQSYFFRSYLGEKSVNLLEESTIEIANKGFSSNAVYILEKFNQSRPLFIDQRLNPAFIFNRQRFLQDLFGVPFLVPIEFYESAKISFQKDKLVLCEFADAFAFKKMPTIKRHKFASRWQVRRISKNYDKNIAVLLEKAVVEAIQNQSREKFFAALYSLENQANRLNCEYALYSALFFMAEQDLLVSSASWLVSANEPNVAMDYLIKAQKFDIDDERIPRLLNKIQQMQQV